MLTQKCTRKIEREQKKSVEREKMKEGEKEKSLLWSCYSAKVRSQPYDTKLEKVFL